MLARRLSLVLATALAFLWPALVNGGPFWFPDTSNYIRAADAATVVLTHSPSEWSDRLAWHGQQASVQAQAPSGQIGTAKLVSTRPVLTGRSVYYGFLIYLPMRFGGPWAAVFLQALLCSAFLWYCVSIAFRDRQKPRAFWSVVGIAVLAVLTPLPFYVSMLMPDVYSGLIVLGLASLIAFWPKLLRSERILLILCCGAMGSFHTTHMLLTVALGIIGVAIYLPRRKILRPLLATAPVLLIGIIAEIAFTTAVTHALHTKPMSPPFLSARLTAAGPGTDYLRKVCSHDRDKWALCQDVAKLPLESDSFLWSEDPNGGVFQVANDVRKHRLASEDKRFALAVIESDPVGVIGNSIRSTVAQLFRFNLLNFNYPQSRVANLSNKYPPGIAKSIATTRAARNTMLTAPTVILTVLSTILSLALLFYFLFEHFTGRKPLNRNVVAIAGLLILGVLANAAICGGLSGPHARYQMRIIWLLPYAAGLLAFARAAAYSYRSGDDPRRGTSETNHPDTVLQ
ncbi:MAG: hypothetical protein ABGW87_04185 [Sphingomonadaceae bacterium]